jgi:capsular exopolysaccharide synthesis family protein
VDRLPVGWDEGPGLVASVLRYRWLVVALVLAGALAGVGFSLVQPVMYEASSRVLLARQPAGEGGGQSVDPDRYVRNQAAFVMSPPVLERAVRAVKGRVTVKQLRERVVAEPSKESDLVTVRAQDPTARGAVELAEAVGGAYRATVIEQAQHSVDRAVEQLQANGQELSRRLAQWEDKLEASPDDAAAAVQRDAVKAQLAQVLRRAEDLRQEDPAGDPVALLERAELPESPAQPKPLRLVAVGGLLGLVVAAGLAWWLAWRRQAPATTAQPEWTTAPLLGEIPDFAELAEGGQVPTSTDPESAPGQAYRELAASLRSVLDRTSAQALVVTSPELGDGKTLTSVNLAVALGESGEHVVLVDADGRQRGLSRLCDIDGQPGLTDLAVDAVPIDYCLWLPTFTSIQVIPAGAPVPDPSGFLQGPSFAKAMLEVRQHAGVTVVDAPPLLSAPDALAIARQVEGVVLVVRPETSAVTLIEAGRQLDEAGARLLGYVVNRNAVRHDRRSVGDSHEPPGTAKELEGTVRLAGHGRAPDGPARGQADETGELAEQAEGPVARENTGGDEQPAGQSGEFVKQAVTASRQVVELPAQRGQSNGR